ncbi:hypothetical protein [Lacibacter sediminis]|uniref:TonB-dependent receptor plug domain-containing protein n=1 Tax=Lacibacter sediminis TaxID=2760713 RepID=A0A7G5XBY0_9BACT|nr:hypothetical protein [Lacibacter sediminis]QNA42983.1 hypothetical protein H4075_12885 [Lacibacter sediminis]
MKKCMSLIGWLLLVCHSFSQEQMFALPSAAPTAVQQILQGGRPGPALTIRIRCSRSISSNNIPLYVVNGVLYESSDIAQINPADILEIQILKTPTAESIYGCVHYMA